jgi:hypothetical protein
MGDQLLQMLPTDTIRHLAGDKEVGGRDSRFDGKSETPAQP